MPVGGVTNSSCLCVVAIWHFVRSFVLRRKIHRWIFGYDFTSKHTLGSIIRFHHQRTKLLFPNRPNQMFGWSCIITISVFKKRTIRMRLVIVIILIRSFVKTKKGDI